MHRSRKNLFSIVAVAIFMLIATASKVNKIHMGAFNANNKVEGSAEKDEFYLVKNDGTKIHGSKRRVRTGIFVKDHISMDDEKYPIPEIKGYMDKGVYYGRVGNRYIQRIVHGTINVYIQYDEVSNDTYINGRMSHSSYTRTTHFAQRGDDGAMHLLANETDIKKVVADCPASVEMIDMSSKKIRKAIKKNRNYLNDVFEIYNNGCKAVTTTKLIDK